jgi:uncharacterized protein (DUF983 family)
VTVKGLVFVMTVFVCVEVTKNVEYDDYLQTWIPVATVVGLSVLLWLMSLVTTSLQPDTLGL